MKKAKRLLAGLLALLLMVTGVPLYGMEAQAAETLTDGDYTYQVNNDGNSVIITGYNSEASDGDVTIPATLGGKDVTAIGDYAFFGCSNLTSVTIPDSVTSIGDQAFRECSGLTSLSIPDSVTSIGDSAFYKCSGLTSLSIPDSITSISEGAFSDCDGLTSLSIPVGVTSIGGHAFYGCSGLTSLSIPDGVTSIGKGAFRECSGLTSLSIPVGVTSISEDAFIGCSGLTSLSIPDSVTSIGDYAFNGCSSLTSLSIPVGVTSIGNYAFYECSGLTSVTILDGVTSIGDHAFYECSGLTSVTVGATSIGDHAFYECSGLTSVTILDGVTSIGDYAFYGCRGLTSVAIPDSVTSIGSRAFGYYEWETDPDVSIDNNEKVSDFVIYGKSGSAAEAYAEKHNFPFNKPATGGNTGGEPGTDTPQTDISNATVTLKEDSYIYDGKPKTPAVTVNLDGNPLSPDTDYAVSYSNNINVGTAKVTVTGKGNYKGSVEKPFTISKAEDPSGGGGSSGSGDSSGNSGSSGSGDSSGNSGSSENNNSQQPITCKKKTYSVAYGAKPFKLNVSSSGSLAYQSSNSKVAAVDRTSGKVTIKNTGTAYITATTKTDSVKITIKVSPKKPAVKSLKPGKGGKLAVKWAKDKRATGYQVQVSPSSSFKKIAKKQNATKNSCTFKGLKAGKKYYVRIRSYKKSGKDTLYSAWSGPKRSNKIKR